MIFISRTNEPDILRRHKKNWTNQYVAAVNAYRMAPSKITKDRVKEVEQRYNHSEVKLELKNMCHHKCVYCESHVAHVSSHHIEHYRPKSKYPKSCFRWSNLLLGCSVCNGASFKGNHFPSARQNGPFVNPSRENPTIFFEFAYDEKTGVSDVIPLNSRASTTERFLGLNRPELLRHRNPVVKRLAVIALLAKAGNAAALQELQDAMAPDQEYSAFAITFYNKLRLP